MYIFLDKTPRGRAPKMFPDAPHEKPSTVGGVGDWRVQACWGKSLGWPERNQKRPLPLLHLTVPCTLLPLRGTIPFRSINNSKDRRVPFWVLPTAAVILHLLRCFPIHSSAKPILEGTTHQPRLMLVSAGTTTILRVPAADSSPITTRPFYLQLTAPALCWRTASAK